MKFFIDDLPVRYLDTSHYFFNRNDYGLQIIFPYDRIYPGATYTPLIPSVCCTHRISEQYAYMCDLKRTLDATVRTREFQFTGNCLPVL